MGVGAVAGDERKKENRRSRPSTNLFRQQSDFREEIPPRAQHGSQR